MAKRRKRQAEPSDPDLDIWVRLGGAEPESALLGLAEDQQRIAEGNATLRGLMFQREGQPAVLSFGFAHGRFRGGQEGEVRLLKWTFSQPKGGSKDWTRIGNSGSDSQVRRASYL
jgi:hypothetical protein